MDLQLAGKHVLVTGGSKGIGLACAKAFLAEGAKVSVVSRSAENLAAAARGLREGAPKAAVTTIAADLKLPAEAARALEEAEAAHGPVDVLVNSAGAAQRTVPDELGPDAWRAAMDAKFFTYVHMIDLVIKRMGGRGTGAIVNVIGAGGKAPSAYHLPGGAANAALMLISAGLAVAYGPRGVRVNAVNPGATLTERLQSGLEVAARLQNIPVEEARRRATAEVPLGRLAEPEEIANVVVFLASPAASYVTGAIVSMDGAARPMVV